MRLFAGTPYDQPPKCDRCGAAAPDCTCPPLRPANVSPGGQVARLSVEKRSKGKVVTVIRGLSLKSNDLATLLGRLKSQCGAGGTIHSGSLEIQGKHVDRIRDALTELGFRVTR
jgi:translation initiation factor 1